MESAQPENAYDTLELNSIAISRDSLWVDADDSHIPALKEFAAALQEKNIWTGAELLAFFESSDFSTREDAATIRRFITDCLVYETREKYHERLKVQITQRIRALMNDVFQFDLSFFTARVSQLMSERLETNEIQLSQMESDPTTGQKALQRQRKITEQSREDRAITKTILKSMRNETDARTDLITFEREIGPLLREASPERSHILQAYIMRQLRNLEYEHDAR